MTKKKLGKATWHSPFELASVECSFWKVYSDFDYRSILIPDITSYIHQKISKSYQAASIFFPSIEYILSSLLDNNFNQTKWQTMWGCGFEQLLKESKTVLKRVLLLCQRKSGSLPTHCNIQRCYRCPYEPS